MVLIRPLIAIASVIGFTSSQSIVTFDTKSVDQATRDAWCQSQQSACPLLCLQMPGASDVPSANDCYSSIRDGQDTLVYHCICSNGISPNASEYSQTIPYFICTEQNNQCVLNCPNGDSSCQSDCRTLNPCGAQNPTRVNATSTTATSTNTGAATSSPPPFTGLPEGLAVRPSTDMAPIYGLCVVLGGFFAGFATLL